MSHWCAFENISFFLWMLLRFIYLSSIFKQFYYNMPPYFIWLFFFSYTVSWIHGLMLFINFGKFFTAILQIILMPHLPWNLLLGLQLPDPDLYTNQYVSYKIFFIFAFSFPLCFNLDIFPWSIFQIMNPLFCCVNSIIKPIYLDLNYTYCNFKFHVVHLIPFIGSRSLVKFSVSSWTY